MRKLKEIIEEGRKREVMHRSRGEYEAAVEAQQQTDGWLEHGSSKPFCSWFQRGRQRGLFAHERDGMLGLSMPNGTTLYLTEDVAYGLMFGLSDWLASRMRSVKP